ncbi:hypothetical protein LTR60_006379, partial [Cryomyces antarcticus]
QVIWDKQNSLCLHNQLEELFGQGRFVIVPDGTSDDGVDEFKANVLDDELFKEYPIVGTVTWNDTHNHRLIWNSAARPANCYLHLHFFLSVLRRCKHAVPDRGQGWDKLSPTAVWTTPGNWIRRSMLLPLANGIEDWGCSEVLKTVDGTLDDGKGLSGHEETQIATLIEDVLATRDDLVRRG